MKKQTELPTKTVSELADQDSSQAEGNIQDLFLDQEIKVTNAELSEDGNGKKSIVILLILQELKELLTHTAKQFMTN